MDVDPETSSPFASQRLELGDGRRLGYVEYGDPTGRPVFLFPGVPGSRLQGHPDRSIAAALGARLIGIDRPGYGLSDVQPGRNLLDWPDDVVALVLRQGYILDGVLADQLGIDRFAVLSISGGGPYAAACAWKIPQRLTTIAMVSVVGPPDDEAVLARMPRLNRVLLALAKWGERPASLPAAVLLALVRYRLEWLLAALNAHLPEVDRSVYERPEVQAALREDMGEAIRPGSQGAVRDLVLLARPWGFRLEDLRVPSKPGGSPPLRLKLVFSVCRLVSRRCHKIIAIRRFVPGSSQNRTWSVTPSGSQSESSTSARDRGDERCAVSATDE